MIRVGATHTLEYSALKNSEIPEGQPGHLVNDATVELVSIHPEVAGVALPLALPKVDGVDATYRVRLPASVPWVRGKTYTMRAIATLPGGEVLPLTITEQASA